jgi:hypothetical protein
MRKGYELKVTDQPCAELTRPFWQIGSGKQHSTWPLFQNRLTERQRYESRSILRHFDQ